MHKYRYINEQFSDAIRSLALSTESLQIRLKDVYKDHIMNIKEQEMPEEIKEKFKLLCNRLASGLSDMTIEEAISIIDDILYMSKITNKVLHQV
jgi:hypothetical protein